ncbi:helix-turn-helix domain-containing protein, partial [Streptomyces sp. f51]|uniref:helix-turn-helix domain-containing protein n=1 Tax=Streptomyces sp. f51 TaxID=1827742 RepID=UPI000D1CA476
MTRSTTDEAAVPPLPSPKERRRLREAKSLSEEEVAAAVGVTRATVRSWETGRTSPRGRKRALYAKLIAPEPAAKPPAAKPSAVKPPAATPEAAAAAVPEAAVPEPADLPVAPPLPEASPAAPPADPPPAPDPPPDSDARSGAEAPDERRVSPAEAFDELYARTAPGLVRQTYLLTGRRALARESVERAFELAWQRWPEVAVDRDPAGWVRAAAYEYAMSPWHRLRRTHRQPDAPPTEPGKRALFDALLDLPPAYRRTLLLYDGVGLDLPETAAETEASTPAAAGRLMTARAAVAERLPELADA